MPESGPQEPTTDRAAGAQSDASTDERLLDFAKSSGEWFWEVDADGRFTFLSDQIVEIVGVRPEDCLGKTRQEVQKVRAEEVVWREYDALLAKREPFREFVFLHHQSDGTAYPVQISGVPVFRNGEFAGYRGVGARLSQSELVQDLLSRIVQATSRAVGVEFLDLFTETLCNELGVDFVSIGKLSEDGTKIRTISISEQGQRAENYEYVLEGSPCESALENTFCVIPSNVKNLYPGDKGLTEKGIEGYLGVPLHDASGQRCGLIVAMSKTPLKLDPAYQRLFEFFAGRISVELDRLETEERLRANERLFYTIIDKLPEGLNVKDLEGRYLLTNREFNERYGRTFEDLAGKTNEDAFPEWAADWEAAKKQEAEIMATGGPTKRAQRRRFADGRDHYLDIHKFPIADEDGNVIAFGMLGVDVTEEKSWREEAINREQRLMSYQAAVNEVVASEALSSDDPAEAFKLLTRIAAETLDVERVSVWRAEPNLSAIECLDLFLKSDGAHDQGAVLTRKDYPAYFDALSQAQLIVADDALRDPRTKGFKRGYLDVFGIYSMLDAPIVMGREMRGVVCFEHVGGPRTWSLEEQTFARALGDLAALIMARQQAIQAEDERKSAELRFGEVVNALPSSLSIKDREGRYVFVNRVFEENYGVRAADVIGKTVKEIGLNTQDIRDVISLAEQEILETGAPVTAEAPRVFGDGQERDALISKFPMFDTSGNVEWVGTLWTDISEQKNIQNSLRDVQTHLRAITENLPMMLSLKGLDGRFMAGNARFAQWHGISIDELPGTTSYDLLPKERANVVVAMDQQVIETGATITDETVSTLNPGEGGAKTVFRMTKFPVKDQDGNVTAVGTVMTDVTEQKLHRDSLQQAEARLRAITENVPIMLSLKDREGRIQEVNSAFAEWHGINADDVVGKTGAAFLTPHRLTAVSELEQKVFNTGEVLTEELKSETNLTEDGEPRTVRMIKFPVKNPAGSVVAVGTAMTDITEQRQAEEALRANMDRLEDLVAERTEDLVLEIKERQRAELDARQSEQTLRQVLEKSPIGVAIVARSPRRRLFVNRSFLDMHAAKDEDHINAVDMADTYVDPADLERQSAEFDENGELVGVEVRRRRLDGTEWWALLDARQVVFEGERAALVWHYDITARKEAEAALARQAEVLEELVAERTRELAESESRLRAITDHVPMLLNLKDLDGRYLFMNERYAEWLRTPISDAVGRTAFDILPEDRARQLTETDQQVIKTGALVEFEAESVAEGHEGDHFMQFIKFPVRDEAGNVTGVGTAVLDITDRRAAEVALQQSEARFRDLFENAPAGITIKSTDGRYIAMNRTLLNWRGWNLIDVVGKRTADLFGPEAGDRSEEQDRHVIETRETVTREHSLSTIDGRTLTITNIKAPVITADGAVAGVYSFFVDVSDMRAMEMQLQQAQKMEAMGRLAGGIAHDFNNLLGAIMGFNEFLIEDLPEGSAQHIYAQRIANAGERAKQLISQVLAYSRASHRDQSAIDMNGVAEEAANLLTGTLPPSTGIEFERSAAPVTAMGNIGQISQILMNLGVNANDAFAGQGGTIRLGVEMVLAESDTVGKWPAADDPTGDEHFEIEESPDGRREVYAGRLREGQNYVCAYVEDNGPGIELNVLERMFDPFFTTKAAGKGTGLGLSVVRGIVASHDGAIYIRSKADEGTRFEVFIPSAADEAASTEASGREQPVRGDSRILVVDDETDGADMMAIGLERLGYEVGVCNDGDEALEVFRQNPELWHAIITDQIMPEMRGMDLIKKIKETAPDVPCIICTGYSDTLTEERAKSAGADAFFIKPVSPNRLGKTLQELLTGNGS